MDKTTTRETTADVAVPSVGGEVQVRHIPPAIQQRIHAKATKGGKVDFDELMVWKLVYGVKNPNFTEAQARELTRRFTMRVLGPILDKIDELSGTDEHLRNVDVPQKLRKFVEPMVMAVAWVDRFPTDRPMTARRPRARGAGRPAGKRATASSRAGPSDDSESSEPPPDGRPPCACGCGLSMAGKRRGAKYLNEAHGNRYRQQRKRWLARGWDPDERDPDVSLDDSYFRFDEPTYEQLRRRAEEGCRCNGSFLPDETGVHCIWCGHDRRHGRGDGGRVYIWARSAETRRVREAVVAP